MVDAVRCAIEMQTGMVERNAGLPDERRIEFRVGIHLGDVVEENDGDLMGDGVNIAARLEEDLLSRAGFACPRTPTGKSSRDSNYRSRRSRTADPQEHHRAGARIPAAPRPAHDAESARSCDEAARRLGSLARTRHAGLVVALLAAGGYVWHAGYATRLLGASIADDKLKTGPRLSMSRAPFENLAAIRSRTTSPMASQTT